MSLERVISFLESCGFSRVDAEVYIGLAKTGPSKVRDLTKILMMVKQQLYPSLKRLQEKGAVNRNTGHPALFNALEFAELIDLYTKFNVNQAQIIKEAKEEMLHCLRNSTNQGNT